MIKVLTGDILASKMQVKVNTVNCVGVMGKGIALLFKKQYPEMYEDYLDRYRNSELVEGVPYLYSDLFGNKIVNFPTKNHWKGLSNLESIRKGLEIIVDNYKEWGIDSIAFPPLGCGNGGLSWNVVGPLMYQKLSSLDIPIEIYAPIGTDRKYLSREFLDGKIEPESKAKLLDREMPPSWIAILEVLHRLEQKPYTVPVGRTMFQKICYMATLAELNLGIQFKKASYGPYSPEISRIYDVFGRENLIKETKCGAHTRLTTGMEYPRLRETRMNVIMNYQKEIDKLVDLFSRVKSAEHAEEIGTIMYALDDLTEHGNIEFVSELEFYQYILKWKQQWNTPQKKDSIAATIRYLNSKEWIRLDYSEGLSDEF
jgi:O-acetyl-ADP-ribose deacetylase (regulator of RNase III)/uncharacterized protein YwgA